MIEGYKKIYAHMNEKDVIEEAKAMFDNADTDKNGEIDFHEWEVATINKYNLLQEQKLLGAF